MTNAELEKRIVVLEKDVALLKKKFEEEEKAEKLLLKKRTQSPAEIAVADEIYRLGREYRLSQKLDGEED